MGRPADRTGAVLGTWALLACAVEVAALGIQLSKHHTVLLYNMWWPLEFGALLALAFLIVPARAVWPLLLGGVFATLWCWNIMRIDPAVQLADLSVIVGALLLAGLYLHRLWVQADEHSTTFWQRPATWLSLAVLVYYGGSAPLLGSINYFVQVDMPLARFLYNFTEVLFIIKFVLMGVALLKTRPDTATAHAR